MRHFYDLLLCVDVWCTVGDTCGETGVMGGAMHDAVYNKIKSGDGKRKDF